VQGVGKEGGMRKGGAEGAGATGSTGKNTLVLSFTIDWSEKNEVCHQT